MPGTTVGKFVSIIMFNPSTALIKVPREVTFYTVRAGASGRLQLSLTEAGPTSNDLSPTARERRDARHSWQGAHPAPAGRGPLPCLGDEVTEQGEPLALGGFA